ncbi:hypothetical protein MFLAVUS_001348 [Mucor flavus]|uniref:Importin N-terminal domain-containing protein n=1 Tax=Mucor flavus TaxID=439312 RepID=A0ABP9YM83_9FUNG
MMSWQPQQQSLRELLVLLRDAADPNNREQALINQRLLSFHNYPDYNAYLAYILMKLKTQDMNTRMVAGLQLKNSIKNHFNTIPLRVLDYIKQLCTDVVNFPDESCICKTVSSVIAAILSRGQVHNWSSMILLLIEKLRDPVVLEFSLNTVVMICADSAQELDQEIQGIRPLHFMIPPLIECYSNAESHTRVQAINATSQFVLLNQPSFIDQLDPILAGLYTRSHDPDPRVRQEFGKIVAVLLEAFPQKLEPYLYATIEYMVQALKDPNDEIVLGACDFWIQYAHSGLYRDQLLPYLDQLIPALLNRMVYSEADLLDINQFVPSHYIRREYKPKHSSANTSSDLLSDLEEEEDSDDNSSSATSSMIDDDDDDDDDDSGDEDIHGEDNVEDAEFYSMDSPRQSSASALDILSVTFRDDMCTILLDILFNQTLDHQDWIVRESGILAIGAAAEGGIHSMSNHLQKLIPYLLKSMGDPQPLVRSISCWAISRFSNWLVHEHKATSLFEPVLFGLLNRLLDSNQCVQESACTGFIVLAEVAAKRLVPYIYTILTHTNRAFAVYKRKNRLFLYDALGTLADAVKAELNQPQYIYLLMPPLITKWNELSDKDTDLFPLLECLSNITAALGPGFIQYVDPVLSRCVKLISSTLQEQMMADQNPEKVVPNVEFLIAALDLLSGIVQGLGATIEPLIAQTNPPLLSLLANCIHDPVSEVLQSTFALLGDIAVASFQSLVPYAHTIMREMIQILCNRDYIISISVYNNVIWALGEIVIRWESKQEVEAYVPSLIQVLLPLLTHPNVPDSIHENAMIALGRLGLVCPTLLTVHMERFIKPWLETSLSVREGEEKETAFRGLCAIIKLNAQGAHEQLALLLVAISIWRTPSSSLLVDLNHVVKGYYRISSREQWDSAFNDLNSDAQRQILKILAL